MINPISHQIDLWAEAIGLDEATLKLAICLFGSFPLNAILKRLPDNNITLKNAYIISISAFYLFGIMSLFSGFRTLLISSLFTFLCTKYLKSEFMPFINFAFVMGHLAMNHFYLQFVNEYDSTKVDITGAQMVLCMKLTGYAWNVHDGKKPESELSSFQRAKAVRHQPSLLNFLSFAFFYPSLLTGPSFDYIDFENWLNSKMFTDLPESKKPGKKRKRNIPKSGKVAFYRSLQAIGWLLIWQKSGEYFQVESTFTPWFTSKNILFKLGYVYVLAFTYRLKYYAAWTLSEASCILAGLGYNGYDKETKTIKWDRVQNIDIYGFETSQNIHVALEAWNQNTNKWLKNYVYFRVASKGKKPGFKSTLFTFLTSAFWHGTRPGYYLSFATGALLQTCGKIYRRNFRPIFLQNDGITPKGSKLAYDVVCYIVTQLALAYLVQPFVILDFGKSLQHWRTVYFYGHVGIGLTLFAFQGPFKKQVVGFFKKYHPVKPTESKITDIIKDKQDYEFSEKMHLGIPEADFENTDLNTIVSELEDFKKDVKDWQNNNGFETEEAAIKNAYNEFSKDIDNLKNRGQKIKELEKQSKKE
ncbi:lysophospholipid acyltransferase [Wickerhamomyces ciferrii]|uniref:Lysophospholipid acyltransferase n=1 Tax=Wickerhamomyces ciferrii (strain ATCC 14091 / BCRC 22168 / CBS 111 / JCM 3599 / NBRC 0793 / NRRL Y-1031 F-60-10) TaxID=1206466 RepID=K0KKB7_WICCF|nr:lysophospholipid acyltransferase [Wickerhamomyces ciferrii]CCH41909.1 lysophospholipid acyltransferase [Wickerhamomyces ciferrii]